MKASTRTTRDAPIRGMEHAERVPMRTLHKKVVQKVVQGVDPMTRAYAVAEGLAVAAVRKWAINQGNSEERDNDIMAVYEAFTEYSQRPDPSERVQGAIRRLITDRAASLAISDDANALMTQAMDAGYLYGLAVGLAMARGSRG